jgi:nucleoid DNA-binding protein
MTKKAVVEAPKKIVKSIVGKEDIAIKAGDILIAKERAISKSIIKLVLDAALQAIMQELKDPGTEVRLHGFATLLSKKRVARTLTNMITKKPVEVPEHRVVTLRMSKDLKAAVNGR